MTDTTAIPKWQQMMLEDGAPPCLFMTAEARKAAWAATPLRALTFSGDPEKEQRERELRAQFKLEAQRVRIAKLHAGLARKALKVDTRGKRWDSRTCQWIPINTQERRMRDDPKDPAAAEATAATDAPTTSVATTTESENDMATNAKKAKKSAAKKPAKKAAAKKATTKKAASDKPKGPGVIDTIVETMARERGATADEILEVLKKKFPDRKADSMIKTVRIQANKNAKKKEKDEKRGLIYYGNGKRLG